MQIVTAATEYLRALPRVNEQEQVALASSATLFLPPSVEIDYREDHSVATRGLGSKLDERPSDLLTAISIDSPIDIEFRPTSVVMPRRYAESLNPILPHLCAQAVVVTQVTGESIEEALRELDAAEYGKTDYDRMWVGLEPAAQGLRQGRLLQVMNRRIGGWDGSPERPVIELLGCGGHVPTVWAAESQGLKQLSVEECILQESSEEFGYTLEKDAVKVVGGFHNQVTNELVALCVVFVPFADILKVSRFTRQNQEQNIAGLYWAPIEDVIELYERDAAPFAGGVAAKPTNYPSNAQLMARLQVTVSAAG